MTKKSGKFRLIGKSLETEAPMPGTWERGGYMVGQGTAISALPVNAVDPTDANN